MIYALRMNEFVIQSRRLAAIRLSLRLRRKVSENREETDATLLRIVQEKFDKNEIDEYDRAMLHCHFRNQMHIVSRSVLLSFYSRDCYIDCYR